MSCAEDLQVVRRDIQMLQRDLNDVYGSIAWHRDQIATLQAQLSVPSSSSVAAAAVAPATRPTTQPQTEQRGVGSGELAQYAALARDIADMEARLDRLEAR